MRLIRGETHGPVLGLDTSAGAAVGIVLETGPPIRRISPNSRRQVEDLAPLIVECLAEAGLTCKDLEGIGVGVGPAPYTGLRIGLMTARFLGLAISRPVWGVCSLDALADQAAADLSLDEGAVIVATNDARRREVYWAPYVVSGSSAKAGRVTRLGKPRVSPPAKAREWIDDLGPESARVGAIVGGGALAYPDILPTSLEGLSRPDPVIVGILAARAAATGASIAPLYLRRPDAVPPGPPKRATLAT